jgi:ATP-dependent DNA helicase Rep
MNLYIAPPGGGKTGRLVATIGDALAQGVPPYAIVATTFTRQAAAEISERLGGEVMVRTLHGLGYWLLRLACRAREQAPPRVLAAEESLAAMSEVLAGLHVPFVEPEQALGDLERMRSLGVPEGLVHPQVRDAIRGYRRLLASRGQVDFGGLLEGGRAALEDPDLCAYLAGVRVHVDEGQDVCPHSEWPLLEALGGLGEGLTLYASPSQQIYGFRGADWDGLCQVFPPGLQLEHELRTRRCSPEIVQAAVRLAGPDAEGMQAERPPSGHPVEARDTPSPALEVEAVCCWVARRLEEGLAPAEVAVLARTHRALVQVQLGLAGHGVPVRMLGGRQDALSRAEVGALLGYVQLALDPFADSMLERILDLPPAGIGIRARQLLRGTHRLTWDHLLAALADPDRHQVAVQVRIRGLLDQRELLAAARRRRIDPAEQMRQVLALSGLPQYLLGEGDARGAAALEELAARAAEFDSLGAYARDLAGLLERPRGREGVQLGTLHAAKGREWEAVALPGWNEGTLPLEGAGEDEEQNLAFVGMTRARTRLLLTLHREAAPSRFLARLPLQPQGWP